MLISRIERFLHDTEMTWTRFGRLSVGDPRFVRDLRNGRLPRPSTESRVERFMNHYREKLAHAD